MLEEKDINTIIDTCAQIIRILEIPHADKGDKGELLHWQYLVESKIFRMLNILKK